MQLFTSVANLNVVFLPHIKFAADHIAFQKLKNALGFSTEQKALNLTDPDALALFGAIPTATGLPIGPGNAMRVPAVACTVSLISETIGALPVKLYDRETKDALTDHPAYRLLHDESNEWTSAVEQRESLTTDALLHGAGHAQVIRLGDGTPYELHRLEPGKVQQNFEPDGKPFYLVSTDAGQLRMSYRDVLRIEAFGGTWPNTGEMARQFYNITLKPWLTDWAWA